MEGPLAQEPQLPGQGQGSGLPSKASKGRPPTARAGGTRLPARTVTQPQPDSTAAGGSSSCPSLAQQRLRQAGASLARAPAGGTAGRRASFETQPGVDPQGLPGRSAGDSSSLSSLRGLSEQQMPGQGQQGGAVAAGTSPGQGRAQCSRVSPKRKRGPRRSRGDSSPGQQQPQGLNFDPQQQQQQQGSNSSSSGSNSSSRAATAAARAAADGLPAGNPDPGSARAA